MKNGSRKKQSEKVTRGGENIFADLGLPDADERLAKAQIAHQIASIIQQKNLNQKEAAKQLGVDQPKISTLLRGKLAGFSMERLFHFLNKLGQDVKIEIAPAEEKGASVHVLLTGTYS
jgi:predicted XRE-type DNA-binding protein